jgi:hypothetical protein
MAKAYGQSFRQFDDSVGSFRQFDDFCRKIKASDNLTILS